MIGLDCTGNPMEGEKVSVEVVARRQIGKPHVYVRTEASQVGQLLPFWEFAS